MSDYRINIANTSQELNAVYRLRYQVFYEEGGDSRYADHKKRHWSDEDDCSASTVVAAWTDTGEAVATLRLTCLKHRHFIGHWVYRFDLLAAVLNRTEKDLWDHVARIDRGVVAAAHRGQNLLARCQTALEDIASKSGCDALVAAPRVDNVGSRRAHEKTGWHEYGIGKTIRGFTGQLIYKQL